MHLREEQRAAGARNFAAVASSDVSQKYIDEMAKQRGIDRRQFMLGSAAAAAVSAGGLGAAYYGYAKPANPVRIGVIGTGDEGNVLIGALNPDYVQVVAIADIRPFNIHRAFHGDNSKPEIKKIRKGLLEVYGYKSEDEARKKVKVYENDYRDMFKDKDVEGVVIALPLWLHAKASIEAMIAGKHVLTEKLMGHSVAECKEMGRYSYQLGKLLATGHQRHYSMLYESAVQMIRLGMIGDVHHIRAQWHRGNLPGGDSWSPKMPGDVQKTLAKSRDDIAKLADDLAKVSTKAAKDAIEAKIKALQATLDWNEKIIMDAGVEANKYGYREFTLPDGKTKITSLEELIRWRLWDRTGGGLMAELGSHQLDASGIFISATREDGKKAMPLTVTAVGGRHIFPLDRDCEDHVYCIYEYPGKKYYKDFDRNVKDDPENKIVVTYSSINGNDFGGYGEVVMGTNGTIILEREAESMLIPRGGAQTDVRVKDAGKGAVLDTTSSGPPQAAKAVTPAAGDVSKGYREEIEHWAWCMRNFDEKEFKEKKSEYAKNPRCHPKVAMADAIIALTSTKAIRTGQKIEFQREWYDLDHDATPDGSKVDMAKYAGSKA